MNAPLPAPPSIPNMWNDIAVDLAKRGYMESAIGAVRRAILNEDNPAKMAVLYSNYGNMLRRAGYPDKAADMNAAALAADPRCHGARFNHAVWLLEQGKSSQALAIIDGLLPEEPGEPDWRFARACTLLQAGRFAEGWEAYECRLDSQKFGCAFWTGKPLPDGHSRLLLHAEQGLGDMIMYHRFRPLLERLVPADRVDYVMHQPIAQLLGAQRAGCIVQNNEFHLPVMSLPHMLGVKEVSGLPYLRPQHHMGFTVPPGAKYKIGLVWRAKTTVKSMTVDETLHGQHKSMPLATLFELTRIKGAALYGLQHNATDIQDLDAGHLVTNLGHLLHDFTDLASFVSQMDVVVSVDTAPAHLAGALGVPVVVCVRNRSAWHWGTGDRSPWYDSARVLHMPDRWDGDAIAAEVEKCLSEIT